MVWAETRWDACVTPNTVQQDWPPISILRGLVCPARSARLFVFGKIAKHNQRLQNRFAPYIAAADVAVFALLGNDTATARRGAEIHKPDRFAGSCSGRSRNTGNGNNEI